MFIITIYFLGLAFKQVGNRVILFVSTTEAVLSFNVTSKDHKVKYPLPITSNVKIAFYSK